MNDIKKSLADEMLEKLGYKLIDFRLGHHYRYVKDYGHYYRRLTITNDNCLAEIYEYNINENGYPKDIGHIVTFINSREIKAINKKFEEEGCI